MIKAPKAILCVPPHERAALYRELALKIEQSAGAAYTEETRASYLALARQWRDLADEVDADCERKFPWEM
jgi:hypothetical protein